MMTYTKAQLTALFATTALVALPLAANAAPQSLVRGTQVADCADDARNVRKGKKAKMGKNARVGKNVRMGKKAKSSHYVGRLANHPRTQAEFDARMTARKATANQKHVRRNARIAKLEQHLLAKPGGQERIARLTTLEKRRHKMLVSNMNQKRYGEKMAKTERKARKTEMKKVTGEFKAEMKAARKAAGLKAKEGKRGYKGKRGIKGQRAENSQKSKATKGKRARAERAQVRG